LPDIPITTATLAITGGEVPLYPYYLTCEAAALVISGGDVELTTGYDGSIDDISGDLMRIDVWREIVDQQGRAVPFFVADWQRTMERIEAQFVSQGQAIAAIQAANAAAQQAQAAASTANDAAATVTASNALQGSFVTPDNVLSASSAGSTSIITIAAHTRVYADGTEVAVNGGSVTNLNQQTTYRIYYDDASRAGGTVQYFATTDADQAAQIGNRHSVGAITTPSVSAGSSTGNTTRPPGYVPGGNPIP
jgi:hypothetical protein